MADYRVNEDVFHALANEHRRLIIRRLARGPRTVGELTVELGTSMATVSKHLTVLENARLIDRSRRGRTRMCRLLPRRLTEAEEWIRDVGDMWTASLDRLEQHLAASAAAQNGDRP